MNIYIYLIITFWGFYAIKQSPDYTNIKDILINKGISFTSLLYSVYPKILNFFCKINILQIQPPALFHCRTIRKQI